ncbi:hypothetical protein B9Z55_020837 [Caenorhabditis nigoni]|uniref:NR LBD domain-containing protein n=1 Tax=Caenorhabditis nigoni TaxID=1611254 RepID=A0A2G5TPX9_9PELO|nr:hypothetical protein B9Z55_020837 [Caenorhabditis nigoni]
MLSSCKVCDSRLSEKLFYPGVCFKCKMFFRRSVQKRKMKKCDKQDSHTFSESHVKQVKPKVANPKSQYFPNFDTYLQLQTSQQIFHQKYSNFNINEGDAGVIRIHQKLYKCATPFDINLSLQLGFRNAIDFANQFSSFRALTGNNKKLVIAEYGLGSLLMDQAFKSAYTTNDNFWMLQNESFLHPNVIIKSNQAEEDDGSNRSHFEFVKHLLQSLKKPFKELKIDNQECTLLKILLLFTPSHLKRVKIEDTDNLIPRCMMHLMNHSLNKSPDDGIVRYGEIVLLLGSIRSAVKAYYNQTRNSVLFDISNFDSFIRNCLVS